MVIAQQDGATAKKTNNMLHIVIHKDINSFTSQIQTGAISSTKQSFRRAFFWVTAACKQHPFAPTTTVKMSQPAAADARPQRV